MMSSVIPSRRYSSSETLLGFCKGTATDLYWVNFSRWCRFYLSLTSAARLFPDSRSLEPAEVDLQLSGQPTRWGAIFLRSADQYANSAPRGFSSDIGAGRDSGWSREITKECRRRICHFSLLVQHGAQRRVGPRLPVVRRLVPGVCTWCPARRAGRVGRLRRPWCRFRWRCSAGRNFYVTILPAQQVQHLHLSTVCDESGER